MAALHSKLSDAKSRLGRLYAAIEGGVADPTDGTLKERLADIKNERDIAQIAFERAVGETHSNERVTEDKIAAFVSLMRENVRSGETLFRRAYIRSIID